MSKQIDRSQAERRALALSMVDGVWDMLMGLFFFVQAFVDPIESLGTTRLVAYIPLIVCLPLGFLAFRLLKQRFTIPRIGLVKTSFRSNRQERRILIILMVMVIFTGVVFVGAVMGLFEQFGWTGGWVFAWGVDLLFGLLAFAIFSMLAFSLIAPRFYLYGALLGAAMPLTAVLGDQGVWVKSLPMALAGLVMVFIGALVFGRFIRQYPLPAEGGANG
jgi:MFS family permease